MDASQYKDYVLVMLFIKYVSDKYADVPYAPITIPPGASFADMVALKGTSNIGDDVNKKIIGPLASANKLSDMPDFNDATKLGSGKELVDRLTNLIAIFENKGLDFSKNRADGDDILGDAYEYLMRHFATESGKSKGQFYTPAEVSRVIAQIMGIRDAETSPSTTVYDPTCGSGSLLLKVSDEATTSVSLYGQEKDAATSGLARMNMILHDNPTAEIKQGNTLANPLYLSEQGKLKTFDYVIANPPFSDKRWSNGVSPDQDPHDRFIYGIPPGKQGDYAYLLHIVRSLKSTGKGACILPHGVLFRGNAEADIRRNLIQRGYLQGIIGLPANLFYGTGIPACIVVIDKAQAQNRQGIFMIDASAGFMKDGNKNRLRDMDIHRIVDVFNRQVEVDKFSRLVPLDEIEGNEFNLNIPRYIDSQQAEDIQDIAGHLQGGIPEADVDALQKYWAVCPQLKLVLFQENRPGYLDLAVPKDEIKAAIFEHSEFVAFIEETAALFEDWRKRSVLMLKELDLGCKPKAVIGKLSEDLLEHYVGKDLIDRYDVYQHLMDYWAEVMQDDCYLIAAEGWQAETYRVIEVNNKGKESDKGWACDLVPKSLVVNRYFASEQETIIELETVQESVSAELTELEEKYGNDGDILCTVGNKTETEATWLETLESVWQKLFPESFSEYQEVLLTRDREAVKFPKLKEDSRIQILKNEKGNITKGNLNHRLKSSQDPSELQLIKNYIKSEAALKDARKAAKDFLEKANTDFTKQLQDEPDNQELSELRIVAEYIELSDQLSELKAKIKEAKALLDEKAHAKYPLLSEAEIKTLVVDDKWLARIREAIAGEMDRVNQGLTQRVKVLAERYEVALPVLTNKVTDLEATVADHLAKMGFKL